MKKTQEHRESVCASLLIKEAPPHAPYTPMTRSRKRGLKEGFNKAVETLLSTKELEDMSRIIQEATSTHGIGTKKEQEIIEYTPALVPDHKPTPSSLKAKVNKPKQAK